MKPTTQKLNGKPAPQPEAKDDLKTFPMAVSILGEHPPDLKIRLINVVDLMKLQSTSERPHGFSESDHHSLFKHKHGQDLPEIRTWKWKQ
jgi:phosphoketolase